MHLVMFVLPVMILSCGQISDGYLDHKLDCVDGCTNLDSSDGNPNPTPPIATSGGQPGVQGETGPSGRDGTNGGSGPSGPVGDRGSDGSPGAPGTNGADGTNGNPGPAGNDGHSIVFSIGPATGCTGATIVMATDLNDSGTLDVLLDGNIQSVEICNGENGQDAPQDSYTPVDIVDPCGDSPTHYDEVLLRLANGKLLASFSDNANGLNTRFSVIPPGNYVTTDGTGCYFNVANDWSVTW